jgi:hypothetical protein
VNSSQLKLRSEKFDDDDDDDDNNNNNNIFDCKWAVARWQWLLCTYINMKQGSKKFKSGGLHEKHAIATWSLGNHLSICL